MKILILKPSSLGDVIQSLPVLRLLRRHLPKSEIYWWIEGGLAPLLSDDPDLTDIVRFERKRWAQPANWSELVRSIGWMREQRFDWVLDLQGLMRSGVFGWLANGKLLVGLDEPREGARGFYDIIIRRPPPGTHAVEWYVSVLPPLGVPVSRDFDWMPPRPSVAAAIRKKWPVENHRWLLLQPGARWLNKRWPVEYYCQLLRQIETHYGQLRCAILGGAEDRPLGATIAQATKRDCLDLTGQLSLPEMVEWVRAADLMVTNDTGPMHVAAALGKPLVALFGPTEPWRVGPYGQLHHTLQSTLPCVPCIKSYCAYPKPLECLRLLSPTMVFNAVRAQLPN